MMRRLEGVLCVCFERFIKSYFYVLYVCDFFLCIYIIVFLFLFDCMVNIVGDRMILLYF